MNKVFVLVLACVILAILKLALMTLLVALALALLFCLVTRPCETIAALGVAALSGLASARPAAFIVGLAVLGVVVVFVSAWRRSRRQLLLTHTGTKPRSKLLMTDGRGHNSN